MNFHNLSQIALIFLLSTVKLGFGGVPAAVIAKFHFFKAVTITSAGGITGCIIFAHLSEWVLKVWNGFRLKFFPYHKPNKYMHGKLAHTIHKKWGLLGLAFFTPFILSIPIGTLLAIHFYPDKHKVLSFMLISITAWDILFYYIYNSFFPFLVTHFAHFL
jgi:hypothetical protein